MIDGRIHDENGLVALTGIVDPSEELGLGMRDASYPRWNPGVWFTYACLTREN